MNFCPNSKAICCVGCYDADLDLFESQYAVPEGISYNSYVILDEKIAVLDTIDPRKCGEWQENLAQALDGRSPDYLVIHHLAGVPGPAVSRPEAGWQLQDVHHAGAVHGKYL